MNKSQLISAVAKASGLEKRQSEKALDAFVSTVIGEVKSGRKVSVIGFGAFNPTSRGARQGRNPQTGAPVRIGPSKGVRFAAGSTFKDAVNGRAPVPTVTPLPPPAPPRGVAKAAKKTTGRKSIAKKATRKKATSKRGVARKAPTKKATRKKATAKRSSARKPASRRTARKATRR